MVNWSKSPVHNPEEFRKSFLEAKTGTTFSYDSEQFMKLTETVVLRTIDRSYLMIGIDF